MTLLLLKFNMNQNLVNVFFLDINYALLMSSCKQRATNTMPT